MRGEIVLVRAFGGKPLKRRVWDVGVGVVYITNDEQFQNLLAGRRAVKPIGFPREDVFKDIQNQFLDHGTIDWSKLVPWQIPCGTQENPNEIGAKPMQYPLCFEVAAWKELDSTPAIQLPMFPGLAAEAENTHTRNSKRAFNEKKRRRFGSSTTEIPKCGLALPQG